MPSAKYRLSDNQFLCVWPQRPDFDPATEGVQDYLDTQRPDIRLHRYDATAPDKKRLATAQELAAYDSMRADAEANTSVTANKQLLVLAEYLRLQLNVVRQALPVPLAPIMRQQAVDDLKAIWKVL